MSNSTDILFIYNNTNNIENQLKIYPNPTNGQLNIKTDDDFKIIKLFNNLGKVVLNKKSDTYNNKNLNLDLSSLKNGIYYLQIETKNEIFKQSIILQ